MVAENHEKRLDELISALLEQSITESQFAELNEFLRNDPSARKHYLSLQMVEAGLREKYMLASKVLGLPTQNLPAPITNTFFDSKLTKAVVALAALVAIVISGASIWEQLTRPVSKQGLVQQSPERQPKQILLDAALARVTNLDEAVWESPDIEIGSLLNAEEYELKFGHAEITFDSGSVVTIVNHCKFRIINANRLRVKFGQLIADVPEQAVGFQVETPSGVVTDLSTTFGVNVKQDGDSDVHVLKGLVEAKTNGQETDSMLVKESSAIRMSAKSQLLPVPFKAQPAIQFEANENPRELNYRYFSFDEPDIAETQEIIDHGSAGPVKVGTIQSPHADGFLSVPGKFGQALFFAGKQAEVKTNVQGIQGESPRTIMFWAKIPNEAKREQAYSFVNWGIPGSLEGNKWQIGWNPNRYEWCGHRGAIRTEFGGGYVIGSTDLRDNRWHHVCSVFLGGGNVEVATHIRHYIDGKLEEVSGFNQMQIDTDSKGRTMGIGTYLNRIRNNDFKDGFKGWIDELFVFDAALTPSQIVKVMETSIPPEHHEIVPVHATGAAK